MALTPEDVVNKRFQPTKFREGYDQDEVDDFLDEIVVELRRLNQENDELRRRVAELQPGDQDTEAATGAGTQTGAAVPTPVAADGQDATITEGTATGQGTAVEGEDTTAPAPSTETTAIPASAAGEKADEPIEATGTAGPDAAGQTPAPTATSPTATASTTAPAASPGPADSDREATATSAAGVLAMAQKLHDEYVSEGQQRREQIISDAQAQANGLVTDAQETSRRTLDDLEEKKSGLERAVEELRGFERDYRARLKAYIRGQLQDLENQGPIQTEAGTS